jgi:hypothetical protein
MTFNFQGNNIAQAAAMPILCRKRKDVDEADDYNESFDRNAGIKEVRRWAATEVDGAQEAQFHPLPRELNLQLLANLGYNVANQTPSFDVSIRQGGAYNHSPSSSASSFICPSTPNDIVPSSAESYFAKGMKSEASSSPSYPTFEIYPEHVYPRPPGLMGMHMHHQSTPSIDSNGDGMDVDQVAPSEAGPSHG